MAKQFKVTCAFLLSALFLFTTQLTPAKAADNQLTLEETTLDNQLTLEETTLDNQSEEVTPAAETRAIANKAGDIIITNSTSSSGITGHVGIYIDSTNILHTSGWKTEPYPKVISETNWHKRYAKSKVIRSNSSTLGQNAAKQAVANFKDKTIPYSITHNISNNKDISKTYCSELVFYSYYKAGYSWKIYGKYVNKWAPVTGLIEPYAFIDAAAVKYNGFTFIDNTW